MRGAVLFVAGVLVGALVIQPGAAQDRQSRALNHVGMNVRNYDEAMAFYTKKMGFREAYTLRKPDGSPRLTYLQINRETFLELIPVGADQPQGLTHFAIEVGDAKATVAQLRQQGVTVADPTMSPGKALFTRVTDLDGVQIEVMEFGPEAMQRKAMDAWK